MPEPRRDDAPDATVLELQDVEVDEQRELVPGNGQVRFDLHAMDGDQGRDCFDLYDEHSPDQESSLPPPTFTPLYNTLTGTCRSNGIPRSSISIASAS